MTWTGNTVLRWNGQAVLSQPTVYAYRTDTGAQHGTSVQASAAGVASFTDLVDNISYVCVAFLGAAGFIQSTLQNPSAAAGSLLPITLDHTNSRVGINNASPAVDLDIGGTAPIFQMTDTTASAKNLRLKVDANVASFYEAAGAAGDILSLDLANNRVGIGTAGPSALLHVLIPNAGGTLAVFAQTQSGSGGAAITLNGGATGTTVRGYIGYDNTSAAGANYFTNNLASALIIRGENSVQIGKGSAAAITIDASNNVGIGTTAPDVNLHVEGSGVNVALRLKNTGTSGNNWLITTQNSAGGLGAGPLHFYDHTASTVRMSLNTGLIIGAPAGGDKGAGSINAVTVYRNGTALDYVFEPEYHLLSIAEMRSYYEAHHHLPTIPTRNVHEGGSTDMGALTDRLWETIEVQARYIAELDARLTKAGL